MPDYLNEAETRAKLIDPVLHSLDWSEDLIRREETPGQVIEGPAKPHRQGKRVDYLLQLDPSATAEPITVAYIEAKSERYPANRGLSQAKSYSATAQFRVPFVYSTNGHRFVEFDSTTGITSDEMPLASFPTPDYLRTRYEAYLGHQLESTEARPLLTPYSRGRDSVRYYQDAAIRSVFEALARGENRMLLSMATGTGKTLVAVNILKRLSDAGQLTRALFLCDRGVLREQGWAALNGAFGSDAAMATSSNPERNARVIVATYQTLGVSTADDDASYLKTHYSEGFFSHIVIDECHRSAWGKWKEVLTRNPNAVHIGLTATPRTYEIREGTKEAEDDEIITSNNLEYFGEPVYEYSIGQGMGDGYLALMRIARFQNFISGREYSESESGVTRKDLERGRLFQAGTGEPVPATEATRETYRAPTLEDRLVMPDRCKEMCRALFDRLSENDEPEQKTIIYCVNIDHANAVANEMNNLYADWCRSQDMKPGSNYAFPCTAESGKDNLADFKGSKSRFFVATTVDLLTTGVDVPCVENIVFFRYIKSPILFHQIIGRGTRIDEANDKLAFTIYDFTNATRLMDADLHQRARPAGTVKAGTGRPPETTLELRGIRVEAREDGNYLTLKGEDGSLEVVSQAEYARRLCAAVKDEIDNINELVELWPHPARRKALIARLPDKGVSVRVLQRLSNLGTSDDFDIIAHFAFGRKSMTRNERHDRLLEENRHWFDSMPEDTRNVLLAIAAQFESGGISNLEEPAMLDTPLVNRAGGLDALSRYPDGGSSRAMLELKRRLFM